MCLFLHISKRKQRRRTNSNGANGISLGISPKMSLSSKSPSSASFDTITSASEPDPDDPKDETIVENADEKRTWSWRIAKFALPVQLALIALFCAACFIEPHCCDGVNNFSWSLTPHLRYVRGPPPVWTNQLILSISIGILKTQMSRRHTNTDISNASR